MPSREDRCQCKKKFNFSVSSPKTHTQYPRIPMDVEGYGAFLPRRGYGTKKASRIPRCDTQTSWWDIWCSPTARGGGGGVGGWREGRGAARLQRGATTAQNCGHRVARNSVRGPKIQLMPLFQLATTRRRSPGESGRRRTRALGKESVWSVITATASINSPYVPIQRTTSKLRLHWCVSALAKEHGVHLEDRIRGEECDSRAGRRLLGLATKSESQTKEASFPA